MKMYYDKVKVTKKGVSLSKKVAKSIAKKLMFSKKIDSIDGLEVVIVEDESAVIIGNPWVMKDKITKRTVMNNIKDQDEEENNNVGKTGLGFDLVGKVKFSDLENYDTFLFYGNPYIVITVGKNKIGKRLSDGANFKDIAIEKLPTVAKDEMTPEEIKDVVMDTIVEKLSFINI